MYLKLMNPMGAARLWQIPTLSSNTGKVRVQLVVASVLVEDVAVVAFPDPFMDEPLEAGGTASCSHPTSVLKPPRPPLRLLSTNRYIRAHVQDAKA